MTVTNKLGLPEAIVRAVENDPYDDGGADISVTSLIDPPRKVALQKRYGREIVEDVSDRIWALHGQLGHLLLERANMNDLAEMRFSADYAGWRVSGQFDSLTLTNEPEGEILSDWKWVSVYEAKNGLKPEREQQLNILADLCRENNFIIKKLQAILILRDWSVLKAKREWDYPQRQVAVFDVPLWSPERARVFIEDRVRLHQHAQAGNLPLCTPEEQWNRGDGWAVMKKGRKSALRVLSSEHDAWEWCAKSGFASWPAELDEPVMAHGYSIEFRPGTPVRCENYCRVSFACSQHQDYLRQRERAA